jgi:hypothetical protein
MSPSRSAPPPESESELGSSWAAGNEKGSGTAWGAKIVIGIAKALVRCAVRGEALLA